MVGLVELIKGEPRTTSDRIAKEFGIAHNELLRKIGNLAVEIPTAEFNEMYEETTRTVKGREYKTYTTTRDGYMFLIMNIATRKAHAKKLAFIAAFNQMEKALLQLDENGKSSEWATTRLQSKQMRLQQTDVIKEFVEYATNQGSQNAKFYYKHVTNATYKALQLIQHKKPKLRDTLNGLELAQLMVAESVAKKSMKKYMVAGEHYKTIFVLVKQDLEALGSTLMLETTT